MAVFRVERTRDYTVMCNHHLKNRDLTLKAKGLISMMLSLPDDWNYTTRGLAAICKEGVESIGNALKELENAGYIVRNKLRDDKGRITDVEYVIYEQPPHTGKPDTGNPYMDKPDTDEPDTEKSAQLNTITNQTKKELNTDLLNIHSIPFRGGADTPEAKGTEKMSAYEQLIKENIEYDSICGRLDKTRLDEIVALMVETVCMTKDTIRVAGNDFPAEVVKSRLLKLDSQHMEFVFDCMKENTTKIRNIKQYLLAVLFNAPNTIDSYYTALVNHDLHGGGGYG